MQIHPPLGPSWTTVLAFLSTILRTYNSTINRIKLEIDVKEGNNVKTDPCTSFDHVIYAMFLGCVDKTN